MDKFGHSVYLDANLCKGCINCIKRCPTQAIRVRDGKAVITKEFCIDCGVCIRICPHHAKKVRRDKPEMIRQFEYTVALPAPALFGQFNNLDDANILLTAHSFLRSLHDSHWFYHVPLPSSQGHKSPDAVVRSSYESVR